MLRPYQRAAVGRVNAAWAGNRCVLLQAPTGAGKTAIAVDGFIDPALRRGERVLFVVHLREIVQQAAGRLRAASLPHGVVLPGVRPDSAAPVQVCSLQTLAARAHWPDADIVIIDEAHRAASSTYQKLAAQYPKARMLGLTATPWRLDGKGLCPPDGPFTELVTVITPSELVAGGFLVPDVVYGVDAPDLSALKVDPKTRDYETKGLAAAFAAPRYVGSAVQAYKEHANGLRTIAFACNRAHGEAVTQEYRAGGVRARYVDGTATPKERAHALDSLRRGEVQVLVNPEMFCEGVDEPLIGCVQVLRATLSLTRWVQMVGRGKRPITDVERKWCADNGVPCPSKSRVVILDHGGNTQKLGFPMADRTWTLEGKTPAQRKADAERMSASVRQCRGCGRMLERGARCMSCGKTTSEVPAFIEGSLVRIAEVLA